MREGKRWKNHDRYEAFFCAKFRGVFFYLVAGVVCVLVEPVC